MSDDPTHRVFHGDPKGAVSMDEEGSDASAQTGEPTLDGQMLDNMSFSAHVLSLNAMALINLGLLDVGGQQQKDLEMAKQAIDTLAMLRTKTEGNLTDEEQHLLDTILYDLRIKYLQQK